MHYGKIRSEANPAGFPEWDGEINRLHYLYCLLSLCISHLLPESCVQLNLCVVSMQATNLLHFLL